MKINTSILIIKVFILVLVLGPLSSCNKNDEVSVVYKATRSISGFDVNYRDAAGNIINEQVATQSAQDVWTRSFTASEGDIVFVSARYTDIESALLLQVLIDGKVYKEGSSNADTLKYLTVSGTVPFN